MAKKTLPKKTKKTGAKKTPTPAAKKTGAKKTPTRGAKKPAAKKPKARVAPKKSVARTRVETAQLQDVPSPTSPDTASPLPAETGGAIVSGTDPCHCGCAPEVHGRDPEHPGSTSCLDCEEGVCIAYEADPDALASDSGAPDETTDEMTD